VFGLLDLKIKGIIHEGKATPPAKG
jgi:hypothetical protein